MAHGHTHHFREHHPHQLERRAGDTADNAKNPFVAAYQRISRDFENAFGGNSQDTTEDNTATATEKQPMMGVGPAVAATRTTTKANHPTDATANSKETATDTANTAKETTKDTANKDNANKDTTADTKTHTEHTATHKENNNTTKDTAADAKTHTEHTATHKEATTTADTKAGPTRTEATTTSEDNKTATNIQPTDGPANSMITSVTSTGSDPTQNVNGLLATNTASPTDAAASTSTSSAIGTQSEGLSTGAIAGIAVGAVAGVALLAALIFFLVRKKKRDDDMDDTENEKTAFALPPPPPVAKPSTPSTPPQLNVRPVTQFAPDFGGNNGFNPANAAAAGAAAGAGAAASRNLTGNPPSPPRSATGSNPFNDPTNPFSAATTPVSETGPSGSAAAMGGAGVAAMGSNGYSGQASGAHSPGPGSFDGESVASATLAADGAAGMAAVAGAASGASPNNVHRVQMDFNPSMEDELPLRSGSLVRMLHEYDDGWVSSKNLAQNNPTYSQPIGSLRSTGPFPARRGSSILFVPASCQASLTSSAWGRPWPSRPSTHGSQRPPSTRPILSPRCPSEISSWSWLRPSPSTTLPRPSRLSSALSPSRPHSASVSRTRRSSSPSVDESWTVRTPWNATASDVGQSTTAKQQRWQLPAAERWRQCSQAT